MNEKELEKEKLKETLSIIKEVLEQEKDGLNKLYDTFIGSREDLWKEEANRKIHIKNIEASLDKPYFARIDFQYSDRSETESIYIGKNGISKGSDVVVVDWRAPISSLYYDAEIGECSFVGPKEVFHGNMSLKRQYEIEKSELLNYFDVDLVSNDSLLQKYLNDNNNSRLKSIVSTIQKEQNDVIRRRLYENLIVQGVAGSGKTTVALHRIAYLVYNYMKLINQNQYLVIGPNPVFIKYIKSVLPELDVSSVTQCTFEQFAVNYLSEDIEINSSDKKVSNSIAGKTNNDIDKFKCSMKYKSMLDQFMDKFIEELTSKDLKLGDFTILNSNVIREIFNSSNENHSLDVRVELTIERLCRYIENNNDDLISFYNNYVFELFNNASIEEKEKLRKQISKDLEVIKKDCRSIVRKYFAASKTNTTKLYKKFISTIEDYNLFNYEHMQQLKMETLSNIKKDKYDFEDLAALIYIKNNMWYDNDYSKIRHVVIDEAQDLGEFNFYVMKNTFPSATFSIFGDLAQSIYDYRGVDNWHTVNSVMFDNNGCIINFGKSYRTTAEIMNLADEVSESIGIGKSDLVVRHGNDVTFSKQDSNKIAEYIGNKILEYKSKGYKTIAVISKTNLLSYYINDDLRELGINIPNVSVDDDISNSRFEVCTISNQLAKGLEFDAVIINNASEEIYSSGSKLDMKLLYVAITRALHELDIVYTGELTEPLKKHMNKLIKSK